MYQVLDIDLTFRYEDLKVFIPLVVGLLSFLAFWFTWHSSNIQRMLVHRYGEDEGRANQIIYSKLLGGVLLGLVPMSAYLLAFSGTMLVDLGLGLSRETLFATTVWTGGLGVIIFFLIRNNARKPSNFVLYPEIRSDNWSKDLMLRYLFSWTVYVIGYEIFFRGVLLFPLVDTIGLWPAIAVNIVMYSATHIAKGLKEAVGSIPMSIVLCLICVQTGNVWVAAIVHLVMVYTNILTSFKHNPATNYSSP